MTSEQGKNLGRKLRNAGREVCQTFTIFCTTHLFVTVRVELTVKVTIYAWLSSQVFVDKDEKYQ